MAADDQSNKRPKNGPGASGVDARDARIDALESEILSLRQQLQRSDAEVAPLRQENERLRRKLRLFEGRRAHDVLPVVVPTPTPTVDISRLDAGLLVQIASFVGTSRQLLNLALTCKSFGWQQPAAGLQWPLAEEAAREAVCSGRNDVEGARITLPRYVRGATTWLSILHESEHPLKFDKLLGSGIGYTNERRSSVHASGTVSTAVASNFVMKSGIHYAEFQINEGNPYIGIVRPTPNLTTVGFSNEEVFHFFIDIWYDEFLDERTEEWGSSNVHACEFFCKNGNRSSTDWVRRRIFWVRWEGAEGCETGDTVGMLLNLDEGTLSVYKNKRRLGVMKDGLSGSYCWYVTVSRGKEVTIEKCEPPRV